jgi:adenosylcobinamide-GDP ribazoletransferase
MTDSPQTGPDDERSANGAPTGRWRDELGMAVTFLTRLPWPGAIGHDRPLMAAAWCFPLVGAGVGAIAAIVLGLAVELSLPPLATALLAIGAATWVTGGLHEDGLADLADGFGGGRDAERKRAIMRDSRIGSYGVIVLVVAIGLKASALASLDGGAVAAAALVASSALGRAIIPAISYALPFAAPDGLARMAGRPGRSGALWAAGLGAGIALLALPAGMGVPAIVVAAVTAFAIAQLAKRQIGGATGDVLGGAALVAETAALLAISAGLGG